MEVEEHPLSGLRVLDLTQYVSGPYCTKLLADFGAEVIKIEDINGGDSARRCGPFPDDIPHPEKSGLFLHLNTNKKSITLNRKTLTGDKIFNQLVHRTDVLVENGGPKALDYEVLRDLNPSLIMTSISYFGQDGPHCEFAGADIVMQAFGGIMKRTGLPDREPIKIAGPQAEYQAGLNAAVATLTALYVRDEMGIGQHIDISVMEVIASMQEGALLGCAYGGVPAERDGARHPTAYPSTILPCKDGYVHVDASMDWYTFARFVGVPALLDYEPEELRHHADEIDALLVSWLAEYTREEVFRQAQEWRLPFAMVLGVEGLSDDPQLRCRDFFVDIDHPVAGNMRYPGAPFRMRGTLWKARRAPLLGENNMDVYTNLLGYSAHEMVKLREAGII